MRSSLRAWSPPKSQSSATCPAVGRAAEIARTLAPRRTATRRIRADASQLLALLRALAGLTEFRGLAWHPPCRRPLGADLPAWEGYSNIPPSVTGSTSRDRGPLLVWGCRAQSRYSG